MAWLVKFDIFIPKSSFSKDFLRWFELGSYRVWVQLMKPNINLIFLKKIFFLSDRDESFKNKIIIFNHCSKSLCSKNIYLKSRHEKNILGGSFVYKRLMNIICNTLKFHNRQHVSTSKDKVINTVS